MAKENDIHERVGEPGGPGCEVTHLEITFRDANGHEVDGELMDAGSDTTELALLRTVANRLGVAWGRDGSGWWAAVQKDKITDWTVWRQDDNGRKFIVETNLNELDAHLLVAELEAVAHKQTYWASNSEELDG